MSEDKRAATSLDGQPQYRLPNRRAAKEKEPPLDVTGLFLGGVPNGPTKAPYFSDYVTPDLPPPPRVVDYSKNRLKWPMMGNDICGDCAVASSGHMIEEWTSIVAKEVVVPKEEIIRVYSDLTGFPARDTGVAADVLFRYWTSNGIGGGKSESWTWVGLNQVHMRDCIFLFGNCYVLINLPASARTQIHNGLTWEVPPGGPVGAGAPGSWNPPDENGRLRAYHAIPIVGYDDAVTEVVTWGVLQRMSWSFFQVYGVEAWGVLSTDWINAKGVSGSGFDLATLRKDFQGLGA